MNVLERTNHDEAFLKAYARVLWNRFSEGDCAALVAGVVCQLKPLATREIVHSTLNDTCSNCPRTRFLQYKASSYNFFHMDNQVSRKQGRKPSGASSSSPKRLYLLAYNAVALLLWATVTGRALILVPTLQQHDKLHSLMRALWPLHPIAQGIALLEVLHAVFGIVRASPVTTAMQVASRILVVFGILYPFPQIVVSSNTWGRDVAGPNYGPVAYASLIFAHGVTEVVRYGFFVWKEGISQQVPGFLLWLRYNTFFVLYPLGISSECWLIYLALKPAREAAPTYDLFLKAILFIYIPGSYILYTHMMAQRRKILGAKAKNKAQ